MRFRQFIKALNQPSRVCRLAVKHVRWRVYKRWFPNKPFVVALGEDGLRMTLTASEAIAHSVYWHGRFEPKIYDFIHHILQPGMVVFDLGANIGQYTLLAANQVGGGGQVHSFEPAKREFSILRYNVLDNGFENVLLQRKAVSDRNGHATLHTFPNGMGAYNTLGNPVHSSVKYFDARHQEVERVCLDSYIKSRQIERVDLIKIDVEGGELNALRGASELLSQHDGPLIICEFGDETLAGFKHRGSDLHRFFEGHGYLITDIARKPGLLRPIERQRHYGANYVAVKPNTLSRWHLALKSLGE